jgi:2,4-dienoyl-CoA reductase-like NADH-dependent reductase (Old Yellow Enzyme family)
VTDLTAAGTAPVWTLLDDADPSPLLEPTDIAGLHLRNRLVMAPMTRQFSPGGIPGDDVAAYYRRRASSLGLLITEGTYIDHQSAGTSDRVPRFHGADALAAWRKVADAVHAEGAAIFPQLWHVGASRKPGAPPYPGAEIVSPSGLDVAGQTVGEPASTRTLADIAASFARAAADARAAGFDGVELHGAHGYLLDQFHWPVSNRRADGYGGDIASRVRFSAEVAAAVRGAVGADFPVAFRFSQWKVGHYDAQIAQTPDELAAFLTPLVNAGVSLFHVSTRRYWRPAFEGSDRTLAGWTRHLTGLPVIAIGSVGVATQFQASPDEDAEPTLTLAPLVDLFRRGEFDLVALGRAVLADPEWARKLTDARLTEIRPYDKSVSSVLF